MAKRKPQRPSRTTVAARKRGATKASKATGASRKAAAVKKAGKRPKAAPAKSRPATRRKSAAASKARTTAKKAPSRVKARPVARPKASAGAATPRPRATVTRIDRDRRKLEDIVPTPPSSLDMQRKGSAVRSGRAEVAGDRADHHGMSSDITGGDVDVNVEDAYFTGDEAPGGDNPTPDQEVVDDIGKALGVEYNDNEELKSVDKVEERDRKRWELDPASAEDYKDRK